jgi:hypothetical protein
VNEAYGAWRGRPDSAGLPATTPGP